MKSHSSPLPASRVASVCAALLGALLFAGCGSLPSRNQEPEPHWIERDVEAASSRVVREQLMGALERRHFPVGSGFDTVAREIESKWQTHLGVFKGDGYRRQAVIRYSAVEPGLYHISLRVRRQVNETISAPTDPNQADWKWVPDDDVEAGILMQHVLSGFEIPFELTPEDYDPYGGILRDTR